jgi:ParB family chromosome partitioning protein
MSKRRVFDIEFPDDAPAEPTGADARRGPMASAIAENAEALAARQETQAAIRDENDALAHEFVRLKKLGLIVDLIPLDQIEARKLVRDRSARRDPEIDELKSSIKAIGLSNPIRVEQSDQGYELIQGYRRLEAYRELHAESGDETYARIPAGLVTRGDSLDALYRRMVDENLIRRDISFAEMAALAIAYAEDEGTESQDIDAAIQVLFNSANRQKRSYIRHFATMLEHIGKALRFPEAIPRSLGLQLEKRLSAEPGFAMRLWNALASRKPETAEAELALLRDMAAGRPAPASRDLSPRGQAKTTLRYQGPGGMVRCLATEGRIVMQAERDFSNVDRIQLEFALEAFFRALDGEYQENADYAPPIKR